MDVDQATDDHTMNLTGNTVIPLEYVEFELKHAKVLKCIRIYSLINRSV